MKKTFLVLISLLLVTSCQERGRSMGGAEPLPAGVICSGVEQQVVAAGFCSAINVIEQYSADCTVDAPTLLANKVADIINAVTPGLFPLDVLAKAKTNHFNFYNFLIPSAEAANIISDDVTTGADGMVNPPPTDVCSLLVSGNTRASFMCSFLKADIYNLFKCAGMDSALNQQYFAKAFSKYLLSRGYKSVDKEQAIMNSFAASYDVKLQSL